MAAMVFGFMLFFADPAERWYVQAVQIGAVAVVITTTLFIIRVLDSPFETGGGELRPIAMERTLEIVGQTRSIVGMTGALPCDQNGVRLRALRPGRRRGSALGGDLGRRGGVLLRRVRSQPEHGAGEEAEAAEAREEIGGREAERVAVLGDDEARRSPRRRTRRSLRG